MMEQIFIKAIGIVVRRNLGGISLQMMMETLIILHLLDFVCFSHGNEARILFANKIRILKEGKTANEDKELEEKEKLNKELRK